MPRKRFKQEEFVAKLRQVEVLTAQGKTAVEAICKSARPRAPSDPKEISGL